MSEVRRPASATDADGKDLLVPTTAFLNGVGLLPDPANPEKTEKTRSSEDNSLEISKKAQTFTTLATGGGAGVSVIGGVLAATVGQSELVVAAMAIATAIIVAAGIYGASRIADGDTRSRSALAGNALQARADVAKSLLTSYDAISKTQSAVNAKPDGAGIAKDNQLQLLMAAAAFGIGSQVTDGDGGKDEVKNLRWSKSRGLEVQLQSNGDFVGFTELTELRKTP